MTSELTRRIASAICTAQGFAPDFVPRPENGRPMWSYFVTHANAAKEAIRQYAAERSA